MELTGASRRRGVVRGMVALLMGALATVGCELLTPDDQSGVIDARVQDDSLPFPEEGERGGLAGTVEVEMRISVRDEDGTWTALGPYTTDVLDLQMPSERALHGPQWLRGAWYTHVRVELLSARVMANSTSAPVEVDGPVDEEFDISDFRLDQDETVFIVVALNVEEWVDDWTGSVSSALPSAMAAGAIRAFVHGVIP